MKTTTNGHQHTIRIFSVTSCSLLPAAHFVCFNGPAIMGVELHLMWKVSFPAGALKAVGRRGEK